MPNGCAGAMRRGSTSTKTFRDIYVDIPSSQSLIDQVPHYVGHSEDQKVMPNTSQKSAFVGGPRLFKYFFENIGNRNLGGSVRW